MEKVDELIKKLATQIIGRIDANDEVEREIEGKTKALAELVTARALMN